ncbi:predicted protein [Pyrenophora tritici-repentis Pt-1C-BFP]|uniref:Uncharacterized protein n=1 Tax=Pyrenophora tritici-repentis (strain Pt-1C-BFP) TaxID=426418 RepID=B2VW92_PYRTR|nr:uncharacterized protein PTRG_01454 [Pyrenophora tritici-repentis Pt-1C-BFP]EDU40892.1 predicted protein [Pyrenophora tritici-repentis Pt-1C-BFP]
MEPITILSTRRLWSGKGRDNKQQQASVWWLRRALAVAAYHVSYSLTVSALAPCRACPDGGVLLSRRFVCKDATQNV